ncbi:MAG: hypothetical protein A3J59_03910 [Candidatus Buchananbacteria bacterium RIFCSPHIGHO2_02_FULL_56_16]|uniref:Uncharacterized protein n=1 Tax=Candidatus Buchananbacteria bacterium RIFCSPHIGHO2_02_FULL_56_16 TaxID=1797542 RepID=A0A1G1YIE7_9BACT|nr:MAG: hypothetical protein A3J59_03910 [Candidatus Buchananbacteria bacterium RIFCSPHIGHO2_02_FULL_56_16]
MNYPSLPSLLEKVAQLRANGAIDLSTEEDLSIAVMNLVSIEEHCFFSSQKTGNQSYLDLLDQVRQARAELLGQLIDRHEGESWCISKHLLAATMRLIEVGTKRRAAGQPELARQTFDRAYQLYGLFWSLRLKLNEPGAIATAVSAEARASEKSGSTKPWDYRAIVDKLVDCCDERAKK